MIRHSSCCSPSPSDIAGAAVVRGRTVCRAPRAKPRLPRSVLLLPPLLVAALGVAAVLPAHGAGAAAGCPGCGTVVGAVTVWQAALRTGGPKHDLDVVVSLTPVGGSPAPPADARVSMDQANLVFLPHVLAVQKGTTVTFLNSDHEQHNVYFLDDRTGDSLDIGTWGPGVSVDHTFERAGLFITLCKLHLEMAAYVLVLDGPWFTTIQLDPEASAGRYEIGGVPPGEYELTVWHKKLKQKGGTARVEVGPDAVAEVDVVLTKAKYARN